MNAMRLESPVGGSRAGVGHARKARGFTLADHALSLYAHCTKSACPHRGAGSAPRR